MKTILYVNANKYGAIADYIEVENEEVEKAVKDIIDGSDPNRVGAVVVSDNHVGDEEIIALKKALVESVDYDSLNEEQEKNLLRAKICLMEEGDMVELCDFDEGYVSESIIIVDKMLPFAGSVVTIKERDDYDNTFRIKELEEDYYGQTWFDFGMVADVKYV